MTDDATQAVPWASRRAPGRPELDPAALFAEIEAKAAAKGLSMRAVCEQAQVSPNTTTRLRNEPGYVPDGNVLLALFLWLGYKRSLGKFAREAQPAPAQAAGQ